MKQVERQPQLQQRQLKSKQTKTCQSNKKVTNIKKRITDRKKDCDPFFVELTGEKDYNRECVE